MQLNAGLFRANGSCGYVLKPPHLRRGTEAPVDESWSETAKEPSVAVARLTLLWAEHLPQPALPRHVHSAADAAVDKGGAGRTPASA